MLALDFFSFFNFNVGNIQQCIKIEQYYDTDVPIIYLHKFIAHLISGIPLPLDYFETIVSYCFIYISIYAYF